MTSPIELLKTIENKQLNLDTVFIIGGGPSLKETLPDLSVIKDKNIITTNNAFKLYPEALICLFGDMYWWHHNYETLLSTCKSYIVTSQIKSELHNSGVITFGRGDRTGGITTKKSELNGNNAGHQSINLAVHMGFKNIILIGFDMSPDRSTPTHWHNEHTRATNVDNYAGTMIPGLNTIPEFEKSLGFKVWNLNRNSYVRCFEFADLNQFL